MSRKQCDDSCRKWRKRGRRNGGGIKRKKLGETEGRRRNGGIKREKGRNIGERKYQPSFQAIQKPEAVC
jgi:hypothetical protein